MDKIKLEVCVDSVESAIAAQMGGADRIEMCANLVIGGTTPSPMLYKEIKKHIEIPVRVLIRPRFGDFCYSKYEFAVILAEVEMFRELGADAVVVGCLDTDGSIQMNQMRQIVKAAGNMEMTFHRAFDVCKDVYQALEQMKELGIGTILTSGQKNSFLEGRDLLRELVELGGDQVEIMAGAGVTPETLKMALPVIGAKAYHMSGKIPMDSKMKYRKEDVSMGFPSLSEFEIWKTSEDYIRQARVFLDELQ